MLVPQFLPSPGGFSQSWWSENLFRHFFHRPEAYPKSDGLKTCSAISSIAWSLLPNPMVREKLAPALSSIARWSISNPMEWKSLFRHFFPSPSGLSQTRWTGKKLLFQDSSIAEGCFSAPMVKQGKWIPSTKKYSQRGWSERPGSSLESRGFPSWQKLLKRRWCLQPKVAGNPSIGTRII